MLTAESAYASVTPSRRLYPMPRRPYPLEHGLVGEFPPQFASSVSRHIDLLSSSTVDRRRSPPRSHVTVKGGEEHHLDLPFMQRSF
jgi:hypothetical protein